MYVLMTIYSEIYIKTHMYQHKQCISKKLNKLDNLRMYRVRVGKKVFYLT